MKKTYKDTEIYLGISDIATLICVGIRPAEERMDFKPNRFNNEDAVKTVPVRFAGDGCYSAWLVEDVSVKIPAHYELVCAFDYWMKTYVDNGFTQNFNGDKIEVYRAGEYGMLIRVINN